MAEKTTAEENLNFDRIVNRKGTGAVKFDCAKQFGMPENVLPLWVADMDFKTSSFITDAVKRRTDHGIFGYAAAGEGYFSALSAWMETHHGLKIKREWTVITPGVVYALSLAVRTLTREGDPVLIQQPVYYPFSTVIRENGRKIVNSPLYLDADGKYHMDFEDYEKKIVEKKIRLAILCSPHNPVGRVWSREELTRVAEICRRHRVILVSDEIHADFTFPGFTHTPLISIHKAYEKFTITCTAPSKTFNLAGLQTSNILIPNETLRKKLVRRMHADGLEEPNALGLTACEAAYRYGNDWYEAMLDCIVKNLSYTRNYLRKNIPEVKLLEPEGTYLLWLDFRALGLPLKELKDLIVKKAGLWLDGGEMFGKAGEGFERINIACPRKTLKEALDRLQAAVKDLRK